MNFKRKIKINDRFIIPIFLASFIIIIILLIAYGNIICKNVKYKKFAKENVKVFENNKEQVFKVEKILICSSANAIDLSEKQNLQDMSIYQYTDIAVYINNGEELTNKNTVKKLYIDNISLEGTSDIGKKSLNYKNTLKFGLKKANKTKVEETTQNIFESLLKNEVEENQIVTQSENIEQIQNEKIDFNIIYTNEENENADYDEPTFYTDCSNPITLKYLNKDLLSGYKINEGSSIDFNGKILEKAGISNDELNCKIRFRIVIVNNDDEEFSCWVNFELPLKDLYSKGKYIKASNTSNSNDRKYDFFLMK